MNRLLDTLHNEIDVSLVKSQSESQQQPSSNVALVDSTLDSQHQYKCKKSHEMLTYNNGSDHDSCYMAMPSRRPPQKSMRMGGGALKRHQKTKQEKVTEIHMKLT